MNEYESKSKVDLREKLSGKKVYLKSILPTAQMLRALRSTYTSSLVSLKEFKNKLYVDEIFGHETPVAEVSYGVLKGDWLIDEEIDELLHHFHIDIATADLMKEKESIWSIRYYHEHDRFELFYDVTLNGVIAKLLHKLGS